MIICLSSSLLSNNNKQQICGHGQNGKKWLKGAAANGRKTRDTFVCGCVSDSASERERVCVRVCVCVLVSVREWERKRERESLATVWRQRVLIFLPRRSQQQQIKDTVNRLGNKKKKKKEEENILEPETQILSNEKNDLFGFNVWKKVFKCEH